MNFIGLMVPKLVSLLAILIPSITLSHKIILVALWLIKLVVDYAAARPVHSGNTYKLTKNTGFEVGELVVTFVQLVPVALFLLATILFKAWIPLIVGALGALICLISVVSCSFEVIKEKAHRRKENANTNNKK